MRRRDLSESRWTQPREDCPHPEYWTSTDAQSTELEVTELVGAFVRAIQPELVLETGTCIGQTAEVIGTALVANGHGRLVTCEPEPKLAAFARARCRGLPVDIVEEPSLDYIARLGSRVGFAWLDSLIWLRVPELTALHDLGLLAPGAVIGVHDTGPQHGTLGADVRSIPWLTSLSLRTPRGVTFCQVKDGAYR